MILFVLILLQLPPVPGATNPDVVQANIKQTICKANWTKKIRPSTSFTDKIKAEQMFRLDLKGNPADYEEDHLISLEIGGDPKNPNNLWPEAYSPKPGAREKDQVEDYLHRQVCAGKMTLAAAQEAISSNWVRVYNEIKKK